MNEPSKQADSSTDTVVAGDATVEALFRALAESPWDFDFFTALRRIENLFPRHKRFGHSRRLSDDPIRLGQQPSMAFAPSTLAAFRPGKDGGAWRLSGLFFGLCGPQGPLPLHLTEYVRDRLRHHGDATPARFFDVFHHRLLSLFYRAWATNQQTVSFERSAAGRKQGGRTGESAAGGPPTGEPPAAERGARPDGDRFAVYVASVFGLGMSALRDRDAAPDLAKLHYAGRLAMQTRNAEGLRAVLADYFGMPADVEEFVGQWVALPAESRCRLGESRETGLLGQTAVVGSKVWDCQQKFRVRLGPMTLAQYQRLLPRGDSFRTLAAWVRNYVGDELTWDAQLVLRADEVPTAQLGRLGQLGWSSWMGSKPRARDADDLKLRGDGR